MSPDSGAIEKVIGIRMAIPIAAENPGRAPKMIPTTTPKAAIRILNGAKTLPSTCK